MRREKGSASRDGAAAVAIVDAGVIGRPHVEVLAHRPGLRLAAMVDPKPAAGRLAKAESPASTPERVGLAGETGVPTAGGPLRIDLAREIDRLRHVVGEIARVPTTIAQTRRGSPAQATA
ncbi:hypothetical protein [Aureimonas pseudogalii]|uniref:Uncharacterized protein n=1 Tax=Aureimonas pseudogalii TaxID=1744844 RepID=A0A7W6H7Q9_9HYPH|nr:hypothetical protein [Aureimonas pseudogalii]MBB4000175.1 hypothetical protein [Aureimonas pseudogalii]